MVTAATLGALGCLNRANWTPSAELQMSRCSAAINQRASEMFNSQYALLNHKGVFVETETRYIRWE